MSTKERGKEPAKVLIFPDSPVICDPTYAISPIDCKGNFYKPIREKIEEV